jgi:hypothetical protein
MSFTRKIVQQAVKDSDKSEPEKPTKTEAKSAIGFILAAAEETIISDLIQMINEKQTHSLEGYVFCLSRVVNHNEAWHCICEAFRKCNAPLPGKYYSLFGKKLGQESKSSRLTVT